MMPSFPMTPYLKNIQWTADGLIPAIAQDHITGEVLMMAWMNPESLAQTVDDGFAVYWSRSRNKLWKKGESSGHLQRIKSIHLDCDSDTLLLKIEQQGDIACHTGRRSCFYKRLEGAQWLDDAPVLKNPDEMYTHD